MSDDLPPWEPIADWLCRIEDGDHGTASRQERREYHEKTAKAIAYDIAVHGRDDRAVDEELFEVGDAEGINISSRRTEEW